MWRLKDWNKNLEGDISVDSPNSVFNTFLQKHWAKVSRITDARDHKLSGKLLGSPSGVV